MLIAAMLALSVVTAPPPARQIEAAERAFAADGFARGLRDSFLKHMADDAIVFDPTPVSAKALYAAKPGGSGPKLEWWPAWVVAAKSGDLGLSIGPWAVNGQRGGWYATIWRKDGDGVWRWVYDGGGEADAGETVATGPEEPAVAGSTAERGEASHVKAFNAVRIAEGALADAAARDAGQAYRAVLAFNARVLGPSGTKSFAPTAVTQRLAARPATMILTLRGGGASKAGDLVWTYGEAHWPDGETGAGQKSVAGHYMHVWQRRPEGWRLIFETLINDR